MYSIRWTSFTFAHSLDGNEAKFYKHKKKKNMLTPFSHFEFLWLETCKPGLSCPSSEGKPAQVLWRLSGRRSLDVRARNYLRCLQRLVLPWLPWLPCSNETPRHSTEVLYRSCCNDTWIQNNVTIRKDRLARARDNLVLCKHTGVNQDRGRKQTKRKCNVVVSL